MKTWFLIVAMATPCFSTTTFAQSPALPDDTGSRWYLQGGVYIHYTDDEDYEGPPLFAGVEYVESDKWRYGFAMFQNSFGQFSQYAYAARLWRPLAEHPEYHFKLTAGLVHGYSGEHHDTLPVRWGDSWGLGIIPTLGYRKDRIGFDVAFLKASAAMFLVGYHFD